MDDYTEIPAKLVPKSVSALEDAARLSGLSTTDTINQAIQFWAYIQLARSHGGSVHVRELSDGVLNEIGFGVSA